MITIPCSCRNDRRVPPLWCSYSAPVWGHMHTAKSPSWPTEKNSNTHPLQTTKINGLKSSWVSRGHIRAPQIYENALHRSPSGAAIAHVGGADRLLGAETVLPSWGRAWASTARARGCVCLWPEAQGSSPLPPQPWQTAARGSSSASSLQPWVKAFPRESI